MSGLRNQETFSVGGADEEWGRGKWDSRDEVDETTSEFSQREH